MQLLLKNAQYYANGTFFTGDIFVDDGKIKAICNCDACCDRSADTVIDTKGLWVLPGVVDSHVHFREPGRCDREDFYTGSLAAAAGGVTTVCEMPMAHPPVYSAEVLADRIKLAEEKSLVDIAFYGAAGFENRYELQKVLDAGIVAFKTFLHPAPLGREGEFKGLTVNDDGELFMMMQEAAKTDGRLMFHCENYRLINHMEAWLKENGVTDYSFHYKSRPNIAEVESVSTIIQFAKALGAKVGISHVSVPESCELVKNAQAQGVDIIAETCFHYLIFDDSYIDKFGPYAKCNPPLRSRMDVEGLWNYIADGTISMIGSDHAPFVKEEKEIGITEPIWKAYSGMPGIEVMLPLLLQKVAEGRFSLAQMSALISENTCKNFGIYPQKGCIAEGSDADFVIIDLEQKYTLGKEDMYTKAKDINLLFDGLTVQGRPLYTILRGQILMKQGRVDVSKRGYGCYLPRGK
ncbi:MAG: dihydroorotase [Bacillota bacterium]|jgi:allantoinase